MKQARDPMAVTQKQIQKAQAATGDYTAGVQAVTASPTQAAVAKQAKMLQNLTAAVNNGKWAAGLNAVSLDDWKNATVNKGGARYAAGVAAAQDKILAFQQQWQPFVAAAAAKVNAMPDLTLEDRLNKMTAMAREAAKFQRQRRRG